VFPRSSQLTDPAVANVDHTLLVFTFALPPFEPPNVTRYLVAAEATALPLTVVLNKSDVVDGQQAEAVLQEVRLLVNAVSFSQCLTDGWS
jgi:ribosome biogenesis GTPase